MHKFLAFGDDLAVRCRPFKSRPTALAASYPVAMVFIVSLTSCSTPMYSWPGYPASFGAPPVGPPAQAYSPDQDFQIRAAETPLPQESSPARETPFISETSAPPEALLAPVEPPELPAPTTPAEPARASHIDLGPPSTPKRLAHVSAEIDFAGVRVSPKTPSLFDEAGGPRPSAIWPSFVSRAFAATPPSRTCTLDRMAMDSESQPGVSPSSHNTAEFLPGLNDAPWAGMVNSSFIAIPDMAVLRSHSAPANDVVIEVYPHWDKVGDKGAAEPALSLPAVVRTYEAQNGFLYRALVRPGGSPIACLDILIPYTGFHALNGRIHYYRGRTEYVATFVPALLNPSLNQ